MNKMAIKLKLTEPKIITPLLNGIPQTVQLNDSLFFKYEIIGDGEDKTLFDDVYTLLQASRKQGIQIYMHNYDRYPSSDNWLCAFGDIDKELVNLFNVRAYMRSMCFQTTPFDYDDKTDTLGYKLEHKHNPFWQEN